jgi:diacylglycerol O-acyltransferase-1
MSSRTEAMTSEESQANSANGVVRDETPTIPSKKRSKYRHVAAYHSKLQHSSLSREADVLPNFLGFRNLMVLVLGMDNPELAIYGID